MTRGRHGCDAVLENGPAAPELRHRCASLHHGRGPAGPAEYKCVARVRVRHGELPSDREIRLDRTKPHTSLPRRRPGLRSACRWPIIRRACRSPGACICRWSGHGRHSRDGRVSHQAGDRAGADPGGLRRRSAARRCADGCRVWHQYPVARGDRRSGAELCRRHPSAEFGVAAGKGTAAAAAVVGSRPSPEADAPRQLSTGRLASRRLPSVCRRQAGRRSPGAREARARCPRALPGFGCGRHIVMSGGPNRAVRNGY